MPSYLKGQSTYSPDVPLAAALSAALWLNVEKSREIGKQLNLIGKGDCLYMAETIKATYPHLKMMRGAVQFERGFTVHTHFWVMGCGEIIDVRYLDDPPVRYLIGNYFESAVRVRSNDCQWSGIYNWHLPAKWKSRTIAAYRRCDEQRTMGVPLVYRRVRKELK